MIHSVFDVTDLCTIITLVADDPEKTTFSVHKELACAASPVLKAALNSQFLKGWLQRYHVTECGVLTTCLFVKWMYTRKLELLDFDSSSHDEINEELTAMAGLWNLADKMLMPKLQNDVMDVLFARWSAIVSIDELPVLSMQYIFDHSGKSSKLRNFMIEFFACNVETRLMGSEGSELTKDLLVEIIWKMSAWSATINNRDKQGFFADYYVPIDD